MTKVVAVVGKLCADDIDECVLYPNRCRNGATCRNTNGSYLCHCPRGYQGRYCDINPNDCQPGLYSIVCTCTHSPLTSDLPNYIESIYTAVVNYNIKVVINTLAAELLCGNSPGLHYTTFSSIIQYTDSAHLTAPPVCWYVY